MSGDSKAVFLSYASEDSEAAQRIAHALKAAGIQVWFDRNELRGGDAWDRKIREQIHDCRLFIPVVSANTERRDEGYFRREWTLAAERTRDMAHSRTFIIPVVIDATAERGASVPEKFYEVQWTPLPGGETPPGFVERIERIITPDPPPPEIVSGAPIAPVPVRSARRRSVHAAAAWGVAAATAVAVAFVVADRFSLATRFSPPASVGSAAGDVRPQAGAVSERSIAVLPFVDMSEKHDQEYFGDGLAEELIDRLSQSHDLKVISRTSSFHFKGRNDDVRTIGSRLGVAHLLEGSVRKAENQLRIAVQLVRTQDGAHEWTQSYDRSIGGIFEIQKDIAGRVTQELHGALGISESRATQFQPSVDAYALVLKGKFLKDRWERANVDQAIVLYRKALAIQPDYALAWALLGGAYVNEAYAGWLQSTEARAQGLPALQRAVELDPNLIEAHFYLASLYTYVDWDWDEAGREIERMRAIDPRNEYLLTAIAYRARPLGDLQQGIDANRTLRSRNPLDEYSLDDESWLLYAKGDLAESTRLREELIQLNPTYAGAQAALALLLLAQGRQADALRAVSQETDEVTRLSAMPVIYWGCGRRADSDDALRRLKSKYSEVLPYAVAAAHAYRGEVNDSLVWLNHAYTRHDSSMVNIVADPLLQSIRGDPRYRTVLQRMRLGP